MHRCADGVEHLFELCDPEGMAGGMDRRPRRSPSLAERTGTDPAAGPLRAGDVVASPQRHCWVVDGATPDVRAPGLLVEWRQLGGAWQGRVAYVVGVDDDATLVEAWLPASQLERAFPG